MGKIHSEENHPISRMLMRLYEPVRAWSLRWKWARDRRPRWRWCWSPFRCYQQLGSEFMPPLDEGSLLYMPTTMPGISITEAQQLLQVQDRILTQFPGSGARLRQGRPRRDSDRPGAALDDGDRHYAEAARPNGASADTWYSALGAGMDQAALRRITPDHISPDELVDEMNEALQMPGVSNAWTMPIKNRIDMLTTGIRTPVGVKIFGADLAGDRAASAARSKRCCRRCRGTRSVFAERTAGGYFLDFDWNRDELARYGLSIDDAQIVVHERHRRRERHHHDRRPRALSGQRPLHARFPQRPRQRSAACWCRAMDGKRRFRWRSSRDIEAGHRALHAAQRKRACSPATSTSTSPAATSAATWTRPSRPAAREGRAAAGLFARLERPVRGDGARAGAAEAGRAADAVPRFCCCSI